MYRAYNLDVFSRQTIFNEKIILYNEPYIHTSCLCSGKREITQLISLRLRNFLIFATNLFVNLSSYRTVKILSRMSW